MFDLEPGEGFVYIIGPIEGYFKIGISRDPFTRYSALNLPIHPDVCIVFKHKDPEGIERELHKFFAKTRGRGEWFKIEQAEIQAIKDIATRNDPEWERKSRFVQTGMDIGLLLKAVAGR